MLIDGYNGPFDRLIRRFGRSSREEPDDSPLSLNGRTTGELRFRGGDQWT